MNDSLHAMRHSLAHITAAAVKQLWPDAKFGVGPVVENGFYYDIDLGQQSISESDFKRIEKQMRTIINQAQEFEHFDMPIAQAIEWARQNGQPYKEELLNDLGRAGTTIAKDLDADELGLATNGESAVETVSFYKNGDFVDLCRGPHVANTKEVGVFKLQRVAGAYWRGKEGNPQMQRLYGVAFETQEELDTYLQNLELARQRDHRKLGQELDLFSTSTLIGGGLPLFTPRGTILRDTLNNLAQSYRLERGYQKVWVPHIAKLDTYKTSGHFEKFPELLRFTSTESGDELALKPVNCPHHAQIYAARPHSYRDLPVKYLETTTVYRDEKSGELGGLNRVRAITQDDSHVFATEDQVEGVFSELIESAQAMYELLGLHLSLRLSFRDDADNYLGAQEDWERAEGSIKGLAERFQLEHEVALGEAAIYGPKMDFMATDALGRKTQLATVQLDYAQPERFNLEYTAEDGSKQRPVMIHCALLGSIERFMSIYIEHTGGWFPFWLAPEQLRILTINDAVNDYVAEIRAALDEVVLSEPVKYNELRYTVDDRNESLGKKIREAAGMKIPVQLIVGPKDAEAREVSVRTQAGEEKVALDQLADYLKSL
ncbi:MAG TPA: threonine--tRNA ligase [Candidatus Saccharimonadaceae bacterium]|nr:threonine--tRNA ligase [Candidatus Saccharimonadaceae bacterium]